VRLWATRHGLIKLVATSGAGAVLARRLLHCDDRCNRHTCGRSGPVGRRNPRGVSLRPAAVCGVMLPVATAPRDILMMQKLIMNPGEHAGIAVIG